MKTKFFLLIDFDLFFFPEAMSVIRIRHYSSLHWFGKYDAVARFDVDELCQRW